MGRAGSLARGRSALADGKGTGNGLGIFLVNGLAHDKPFFLLIRKLYGTDLGTFPATGAFGGIYVTGLLYDMRGKITRITRKINELGIGKQFDV